MFMNAVLVALVISTVYKTSAGGFTFGESGDFPCNCNGGSTCSPTNGFCASGCQLGWHGPGCQIGNLAFRKTAVQSSTYSDVHGNRTAAGAVDGYVPNATVESSFGCSHTNTNMMRMPNAWWYVVLDSSKMYFIQNITIYNREGVYGPRLSRFHILVTNESNSEPHPSTWAPCAYQEDKAGLISSYTCNTPTIVRRLAVYLNMTETNILTLCEVYINGYEYKTMPYLSSTAITSSATCDAVSVSVNAKGTFESDWRPTSINLNVTKIDVFRSNPFQVTLASARDDVWSAQWSSAPGQQYDWYLTPIVCTGGKCHSGPPSDPQTISTGTRTWYQSENGSCLEFHLNSTRDACGQPNGFSVNCSAAGTTLKSWSTNGDVCGLQQNMHYNCSVSTTLSTGSVISTTSFYEFYVPSSSGTIFGPSADFSCHCSKSSDCRGNNGFCSGGCQLGWFGPGCQIGNLAFGKTAVQSSAVRDHNADKAVDGTVPSLDDTTANTCTHSVTSDAAAWWYVELDKKKRYFIQNITIINKRSPNSDRLSRFFILVTDNPDGDPDPANWSVCAYQDAEPAFNSSYTCSTSATARRLAVYLLPRAGNILTLCEVSVTGYEYKRCPDPYIGPGCLLRNCNSADCKQKGGSTCDSDGSCVFPKCPRDSHWPPECWKFMPSLEGNGITASGTCDSIRVNIESSAYDGSNLIPTFFTVTTEPIGEAHKNHFQTVALPGNLYELNFTLRNGGASSAELSVPPGRQYKLFVTPLVCLEGVCHPGIASNVTTTSTGIRTWHQYDDDTCLTFYLNSSTEGCSLPTNYSVSCSATNSIVMSNTSAICGLERRKIYTCSVMAILSIGTEVSHTSVYKVPSTPGGNGDLPLANDAVLIGGVVSAAVICAIAFVIVYILWYKRRNNALKRSDSRPHPVDHTVPTVLCQERGGREHRSCKVSQCLAGSSTPLKDPPALFRYRSSAAVMTSCGFVMCPAVSATAAPVLSAATSTELKWHNCNRHH